MEPSRWDGEILSCSNQSLIASYNLHRDKRSKKKIHFQVRLALETSQSSSSYNKLVPFFLIIAIETVQHKRGKQFDSHYLHFVIIFFFRLLAFFQESNSSNIVLRA